MTEKLELPDPGENCFWRVEGTLLRLFETVTLGRRSRRRGARIHTLDTVKGSDYICHWTDKITDELVVAAADRILAEIELKEHNERYNGDYPPRKLGEV